MQRHDSLDSESRRVGPGLYKTARDRALLQKIYGYSILHEDDAWRLIYPEIVHRRSVRRTLMRLHHHGYLTLAHLPARFPEPFPFTNLLDFEGVVYILTELGAETIGVPHDEDIAKIKPLKLNHRLYENRVRASLELAVAAEPDLRLRLFIGEHQKDPDTGKKWLKFKVRIRNPETGRTYGYQLEPDGLAVIEHHTTGQQEAFFIESDLGSMNYLFWKRKIWAYRSLWKSGLFRRWLDFNGTGFRVLVPCKSRSGKRNPERQFNLACKTRETGGTKMFWFAPVNHIVPELSSCGDHFLATPIWLRAKENEMAEKKLLRLRDFLFNRDLPPGAVL